MPAGTTVRSVASRRRSTVRRRELFWAVVFLLPAVAALVGLRIAPTVGAVIDSLYKAFPGGIIPATFAGLHNYESLFADPNFVATIARTLIFNLIINPLQIAIALVVAVLFVQRIPLVGVWRTLLFIPVTIPIVGSCIAWGAALSPGRSGERADHRPRRQSSALLHLARPGPGLHHRARLLDRHRLLDAVPDRRAASDPDRAVRRRPGRPGGAGTDVLLHHPALAAASAAVRPGRRHGGQLRPVRARPAAHPGRTAEQHDPADVRRLAHHVRLRQPQPRRCARWSSSPRSCSSSSCSSSGCCARRGDQ